MEVVVTFTLRPLCAPEKSIGYEAGWAPLKSSGGVGEETKFRRSRESNSGFLLHTEGLVTIILFWCGVSSPTPNPQPGGPGLHIYIPWRLGGPKHRVPSLVAFYDMHGLQWDYSFPRSPHGADRLCYRKTISTSAHLHLIKLRVKLSQCFN
jgi:hypothetical protein